MPHRRAGGAFSFPAAAGHLAEQLRSAALDPTEYQMHQTHDHAMLALPPPHSESRSTTARDGSSQHASRGYRRLLVASDGGPLSRGALAFAALLARRDHTPVDVVSVVRTEPRDAGVANADEEPRRTAARLERLAAQSEELLGPTVEWTLMILAGDPLSRLARAASARPYDLLLIGIGRRGVTPTLGHSTALDLSLRVAAPVLAVPEFFRSLPRRVVVGVDGGVAASAAARAAARLLERPASVDLVHVARTLVPGYAREPLRWPSLAHRDADIGRRLVLLARELASSDDLHVRQFLLPERDPVAALRRCAKHARANLIALGNHGSAKAWASANVAESILNMADRCVLVSSGASGLLDTQEVHPDETMLADAAPSVARAMPRDHACAALAADLDSREVIMHDRQTDPVEPHDESSHAQPAVALRRAVRDEVYEASLDSFPASDPPSWSGMRVGGPAAEPPASARDRSSALGERPPPVAASNARIDESSLASQWSDVHVCHMEARNDAADGRADRTMIRAVVQLGALAPADVRVMVRQHTADAGTASERAVRLWSGQSYRNGSFVFEAVANASEIPDGADLLVSVEPSPGRHGGITLDSIVTEFTRGALEDDAACLHAKAAASMNKLRENDLPAEVTR
jgi:nucleotide-binding universal stress UspA family protein